MGKTKTSPRKPNVIPLSMDANFFSERAIRSLDSFRYEKALKYFRRATELEPDNPVNHCNMAGILSEMGDFEASNVILSKILAEIDPAMTECYFYMANNYANMEAYEEAETALAEYLEHDPEGAYIEEAEEMLELLGHELNRPVRLNAIKSREEWFEHDLARTLLEAGKFEEAAGKLESLLKKHPDLLAARNNLALAYFYMGEYEKSLVQIRKVLLRDPGNLHARCNLAVFCKHFGYEAELAVLVAGLKKLLPCHPEHAFKVATTLGMLEEHEAAYGLFRRLLREGEGLGHPGFYHYAAVAAFGSGREADAIRWWRKAAKQDGPGSVAAFWLDCLLDSAWSEAAGVCAPGYDYLLPFEERFRTAEHTGASFADLAGEDSLVDVSLRWSMANSDGDRKVLAIRLATRLPEREHPGVYAALRKLADDPAERADIRRMARRALDSPADGSGHGLPRWESKWQAVIDAALARMEDRYNLIQLHDLQTLWVAFLTRVYPGVPKLAKVEGWAAALEYLTAKMHRIPASYAEVARRYGVSPQTISRHARTIDETCGLQRKMQKLYRMEADPL